MKESLGNINRSKRKKLEDTKGVSRSRKQKKDLQKKLVGDTLRSYRKNPMIYIEQELNGYTPNANI